MATSTSRISPYGPIALRDEPWWQIGRRAAQRGHVRPDGSNNGLAIELDLARTFHRLRDVLKRRTRDEEACAAHHLFSAAVDWTPLIGQYELHGRQIFDLSCGLVNMLQQTDIRDCSLRNLQLPYPAFYMRFGPQPALKTAGANGAPEYIDGVLVARGTSSQGQLLRLATTALGETGVRVMRPGHYLDLRDDEMQLPVQGAIEAALQRFVGPEPAAMPESPWLPAFWAEQRRLANSAIMAAMPLIVNGLFYLENPPRSHRMSLGSGIPQEMVGLWERTPVNRRRRLQSKLSADGYALVHLVGEEIAHSPNQVGDGTVIAHWRRGHWREQAHGPRLSLRKRILIKPTLVNGREADPLEVRGHIYRTSPVA